jgi:hypothetical protein
MHNEKTHADQNGDQSGDQNREQNREQNGDHPLEKPKELQLFMSALESTKPKGLSEDELQEEKEQRAKLVEAVEAYLEADAKSVEAAKVRGLARYNLGEALAKRKSFYKNMMKNWTTACSKLAGSLGWSESTIRRIIADYEKVKSLTEADRGALLAYDLVGNKLNLVVAELLKPSLGRPFSDVAVRVAKAVERVSEMLEAEEKPDDPGLESVLKAMQRYLQSFKPEDRASAIKRLEAELQTRETHRLAAKGIKRPAAAA